VKIAVGGGEEEGALMAVQRRQGEMEERDIARLCRERERWVVEKSREMRREEKQLMKRRETKGRKTEADNQQTGPGPSSSPRLPLLI